MCRVQRAVCTCIYSTRRANQCGAVGARVAGSVVRWQLETRIKVQPLCDNNESNIGGRCHTPIYAPRPGGSAVFGCFVGETSKTAARDNNTIGHYSRWRECRGGKGLGPEIKNRGTSPRRTKAHRVSSVETEEDTVGEITPYWGS
jgi:hypothetical protein